MSQRLLPVLYIIEFLITLITVYTVWGEVGGTEYLDFMPWYLKAGIGFATAFTVVRLTVAVSSSPAVRWRVAAWGILLAILTMCAGLATYYYYLNAPQGDEEDVPASPTASILIPRRG